MGFIRLLLLLGAFGCFGFIAIGAADLFRAGFLPEQIFEMAMRQVPHLVIGGAVMFFLALILPSRRRTKTIVVEKQVEKQVVAGAPAKSRFLVFIEVLAALAAIVGGIAAVYQLANT